MSSLREVADMVSPGWWIVGAREGWFQTSPYEGWPMGIGSVSTVRRGRASCGPIKAAGSVSPAALAARSARGSCAAGRPLESTILFSAARADPQSSAASAPRTARCPTRVRRDAEAGEAAPRPLAPARSPPASMLSGDERVPHRSRPLHEGTLTVPIALGKFQPRLASTVGSGPRHACADDKQE